MITVITGDNEPATIITNVILDLGNDKVILIVKTFF